MYIYIYKADAGLPNTYARERKNNVMRGHDPVL